MEKEKIIERWVGKRDEMHKKSFSSLMDIVDWDIEYAGVIARALDCGIAYGTLEVELRENHPSVERLWSYVETIHPHFCEAYEFAMYKTEALIRFNKAVFTLIKEYGSEIDVERASRDFWYVNNLCKEKGLFLEV